MHHFNKFLFDYIIDLIRHSDCSIKLFELIFFNLSINITYGKYISRKIFQRNNLNNLWRINLFTQFNNSFAIRATKRPRLCNHYLILNARLQLPRISFISHIYNWNKYASCATNDASTMTASSHTSNISDKKDGDWRVCSHTSYLTNTFI